MNQRAEHAIRVQKEVESTRKDLEHFLSGLLLDSVHFNWLGSSGLLPFKRSLKALLNLMGDKIQQKHQDDLKEGGSLEGEWRKLPVRGKGSHQDIQLGKA